MKFALIFLSFFLSISVFACNTGQIEIRSSSSSVFSFFSSLFSNSESEFKGGIDSTINIPLTYEGKRACWKQESALDFDVKEKNDFQKGKVSIYEPYAEFKNLPGRIRTYVYFNRENAINDIKTTSFEVSTFVCAGDNVLSARGFVGTIEKMSAMHEQLDSLNNKESDEFSVRTSIVIGMSDLQEETRAEQINPLGGIRYLAPNLSKIFSDRIGEDKIELFEKKSISITSLSQVHVATSLTGGGISYSDNFETQVATSLACTPEFENIMADYEFDNVVEKFEDAKFSSAKIKTSVNGRRRLRFKWKY